MHSSYFFSTSLLLLFFFFFFNDTATTEIYTLSLHDALPICRRRTSSLSTPRPFAFASITRSMRSPSTTPGWIQLTRTFNRSEEHTSELQSQSNLVCRLLLEKKKKKQITQVILKLNILTLYNR